MGKRRTLNQDYFKLEGKIMVKDFPPETMSHSLKVLEIKARRHKH